MINIMENMPVHPVMKNKPILWADKDDVWLFRRTTPNLIPKIIDFVSIEKMPVKYIVCAIQRSENNGGGVDFVVWQEREEIDPSGMNKSIIPVPAFGPSRCMSKQEAEYIAEIIIKSLKEVYKDAEWISQYEYK